jgi:two-component system CheB/CheR fusion protein
MDMVSCRNLLIYFGQQIQAQVIPTFHYSLKPNGFLFLGTSENISQFGDLFVAVDKRHRIFRAREDSRSAMRLPFAIDSLQPLLKTEGRGTRTPSSVSLRQAVDDCVMDRFAPPHVVVNGDGDVVHYSSRTGKYLEAAPGMPSRQVLSMARIGLRLDLRAALREAADKRVIVTRERIPIEADSDRVQFVSLTVAPMPERGDGTLFIILFTDDGPTLSRDQAMVRGRGDADESLVHLEHDLREARERLQSMIEQYETALEELKSSNEELVSVNEELQSTNEELQSANEELTTSKEEAQSMNEELQTLNSELRTKLDDLALAQSDMQNLLNSTHIATLFLDNELNVRRFTDQATRIVHLRDVDIGRPLSELTSILSYPELDDDARTTLRTLATSEKEVATTDDQWFSVRIMPYRTGANVIQGVVITFVNITAAKKLESRLRNA